MKSDNTGRFLSSLILCLVGVSLIVQTGCDGKPKEPPTEKVRYGALRGKVRGLDPMDIGDTTSSSIGGNIYDTLFQYHYLKRPYLLIPSIATAMPTYSEDKLTLTIPLRKDVYFHDDPCFPDGKGRLMVAEDFIYSWKRLAYVKNRSKNWWLLKDKVVGLNEFRAATKSIEKEEMDYSQKVEGLTAIDNHTLQIKLAEPTPDIEYRLAHLPTAVVPREAVEKYGEEFQNKGVGTGPFKLASWVRGNRLVLIRNEKYRKELYPSEGEAADKEAGLLADAGKQMPFLDRVELGVIQEDNPYWLNFMAKNADLASIPKDNFQSVISESFELKGEMAEKGIILTKFSEPTTFWICFNMDDPVVGKNLALRQGMSLAVDRKKYLSTFNNNRGKLAKGPLPPSLSQYNEGLKAPYAEFDKEKAKEKIKEAKAFHEKEFGKPMEPLELVVGGTDTTTRQIGAFYKRSFESVGLEIKLVAVEWPEIQERMKRKKAQIFTMGWIMDWPDPLNMMLLWYGPFESPGSNNSNYKNKAFDELYEKAIVMGETEERAKLIREMQQMVVDDMPNIFSYHREAFVLKYNWVKNYKPHVFGYGLFKYMNIDTNLRFEKTGR